jgi:hypothetical protein
MGLVFEGALVEAVGEVGFGVAVYFFEAGGLEIAVGIAARHPGLRGLDEGELAPGFGSLMLLDHEEQPGQGFV